MTFCLICGFVLKKKTSFNDLRNVSVIHMQQFNPSMLAIIHVPIHITKERYIICITNLNLLRNTIIQCMKHVTQYVVINIIKRDVCMFETAMVFSLIKTPIVFDLILCISCNVQSQINSY